jgi:hypothetical protein
MLVQSWRAVVPTLNMETRNWGRYLRLQVSVVGYGFLMLIAEVLYLGQCT